MKTIVSVSMFAALSVFGVVACTETVPGPTSANEPEADNTSKAPSKPSTSKPATSSSSASNHPPAPDTSANDAGADTASSCATLNGSCKLATVCNEYYGGTSASKDIQKKGCDQMNGAWSDDACDTTGTVGGCKTETTVAGSCSGGISWMFAPVTADMVPSECPAPSVVVQPGDE